MKLFRVVAVLVSLGSVAVLGLVAAPVLYGQRSDRPGARRPAFFSRSSIGLSVSDVEPGRAQGPQPASGAVVDEVRPDSPADKAGIKQADVITEFDGERVRSARQFARLVEETPAGRTVKATLVRDGQRRDVQVTPEAGRRAEVAIDTDGLRADIDALTRELPRVDFDFDLSGVGSRARLGVALDDITPQLASYFGVKEGVLVSAVTDNSPASRAGLRAGDVVTAVNARAVRTSADLARAIREVDGGEVTIAVVRDKKELALKARLEPVRRTLRSRRVVRRSPVEGTNDGRPSVAVGWRDVGEFV